jgi:photosystem II stability/assembly factor-like uncharacterized protein
MLPAAAAVTATLVVVGALAADGGESTPAAKRDRAAQGRDHRAEARQPSSEKPSAGQARDGPRWDCESRNRAASYNTIGFWGTRRGLVGFGDMGSRCGGTISLTTDGGRSFVVVRRTESGVAWIDTAGKQNAWVVTQGPRNRKRLLHTSDGGITWEHLSSDPPYAPSFATPANGMAVRGSDQSYGGAVLEDKRVLITHDGGESWSRVAAPCAHRLYVGAQVAMGTPKDALAVCVEEGFAGMEPKTIYRTNDAGRNWKRVVGLESCRRLTGICDLGFVLGLTLDKSGAGALMVSDQPAYLTWNLGETWSHRRNGSWRNFVQTRKADPVSRRAVIALVFGGRSVHRLIVTSDRGDRWRVMHEWR